MRKKVVWTAPKNIETVEVPKPRHMMNEANAHSPEAKAILKEKLLFPGALFQMTCALCDAANEPGCVAPPFPYTTWSYSQSAPIQPGDLAIYAGTCRVEERAGVGLVSILRHTFIVGGGRRIVNINNIKRV
jgi:hypothetical protein